MIPRLRCFACALWHWKEVLVGWYDEWHKWLDSWLVRKLVRWSSIGWLIRLLVFCVRARYLSLLYSAILCSAADSVRFCRLWLWMSSCNLHNVLWISTEMAFLKRSLVATRLVPLETAVVSAHVLYTPYNHAPCYVTSCKATYVGCMRV